LKLFEQGAIQMKCDEKKQIDQSYVSTAGRGQRMKHCNILLLLCVLFAGGIGCDIAAEVKKLREADRERQNANYRLQLQKAFEAYEGSNQGSKSPVLKSPEPMQENDTPNP
jgi:hypothetical protein